MDTEKFINERLQREFGKLFRVSWSNDQLETRMVENQGLIIYSAPQVKRKYPTIKDRWILERWVPPDPIYTREIVSAKIEGSYECVYIFQDTEGNFLPLNNTVAIMMSKALAYPGTITKNRDTSESAIFEEDTRESKESLEYVQEMYEELLSKDMKYPDGTSSTKYTDGFKIFVPGEVK